jgi:hypothetical protein
VIRFNSEEFFCLLGYNDVYSVERHLTFRMNMSSPSSGSKNKLRKKPDKPCFPPVSRCFLVWLIPRPRKLMRHVPPKRLLTFNGLYGVMYHHRPNDEAYHQFLARSMGSRYVMRIDVTSSPTTAPHTPVRRVSNHLRVGDLTRVPHAVTLASICDVTKVCLNVRWWRIFRHVFFIYICSFEFTGSLQFVRRPVF